MLTIEKINKLIEVEEGFHASHKLTEIMSSVEEREKLFEKFLFNEPDLSFNWFTEYYQSLITHIVSHKSDDNYAAFLSTKPELPAIVG